MQTCHAITTDQLLSYNDGEPIDAQALQHIGGCSVCTNELVRIRSVRTSLRSLPLLKPPALDIAKLQASINQKTNKQHVRTARKAIVGAVAAAGVAVAAILMTIADNGHQSAIPLNENTSAYSPLSTEPTVGATTNALVIRSQQLDARLQQLPTRPRVERASTTVTIDSLEQRIQWVDYQLSLAQDVGLSESQASRLWQDRVRLMNSLVKVRYAEAQRFALLN